MRGKTKAQAMPYYVFNTNDDNGFVIVSGDDRTAEILAYSDKGRLMQMKYQIICANGFVIMPM